ncbi:MAG TPA: VCBS repeat-containing protein [Pyrinomonadaceae bacterium]|nr:VCBS repeat-containing protein [Pyrinomonadaceae bacterium]
MNWTGRFVSARKLILSMTILCMVAIGLVIIAQSNSADASTSAGAVGVTPTASFVGTNTGAIPDGTSGVPPQFGAPRTINFAVSGLTGNVTTVSVDFDIAHTFIGDVEMILAAPGGSPSISLASRVGVTAVGGFGDNSNYLGVYAFSDAASTSNIWTVATGAPCDNACNVATGTYRSVGPGQTGQVNPPPVTSLNATFAGITPASANGTWTLTFRDAAATDVGSIASANLTIGTAPTVPTADAPFDYNGDGKTDFVVVRNLGGGPGGQARWFYTLSGTGTTGVKDWGLSTDWFLNGNVDDDNSDDLIVWRPGPAGSATFYALKSSTFTAVIEPFGQDGDDPSVLQDYDGDGKTDWAVYRTGLNAGQQSTWFWRSSTTPGGTVHYVPWGIAGDSPAPGDYDGDGIADYVIQRDNGNGQAWFWRSLSASPGDIIPFGLPTDFIVPGDWDGDGKDDIATARLASGVITWYYEPSGTPGWNFVPITFGAAASDYLTQGDYDGDGLTDAAIWRNGTFWVRSTGSGAVSTVQFGAAGDYPVASSNSH